MKLQLKNRVSVDLWLIIVCCVVGTFLFSYVAFVITQDQIPPSFLQLWNRWDTINYLFIAEHGYTGPLKRHFVIVYMPFYPLLVKLFSFVLKNYLLSALVVSNLAYAAAGYFLYKLTRLEYSEDTALRAVFYFSIFPTAYFLHIGYTESLFLALVISSYYFARKGRWALCAVCGMLATGTRMTGVVLIPVLALEYLDQIGFQLKRLKKDFLWLALVPLGTIAYLVINYLVFGDPFKFLDILHTSFHKHLSWPYNGALSTWARIWHGSPSYNMTLGLGELAFAVFGFIFTLWALLRLRISLKVYVLLTWLIITSTSFWLSIPRYTLSIFPIFIALSLLGRRRGVGYVIAFSSLLFYALFLVHFIHGYWAF